MSKQPDHLFDTSKQPLSYGPGSTSIQTRRWYGNVIVEEEVVVIDVCCGLASGAVSLYILQCNCGRLGFPQSFPSRIGLIHSRSLPKNKFHHQIRIRSWSRFRNGLDDDWLPPTKLDRSSCSHGSILLLWIICRHEVKFSLEMSLSMFRFRIVEGREVLSPRHGLVNWRWYGRFANFCS